MNLYPIITHSHPEMKDFILILILYYIPHLGKTVTKTVISVI